MKQVRLRDGTTEQVCWIDDHPSLKVGCFISLKNEPGKWEVLSIAHGEQEKEALYKPWNVGGL